MIRVGIGGWTFAPWRGVFFPKGLRHAGELAYASRQLAAIEVNGTFYRTQTPASFAKWRNETPDDFVFALKGPRYTTNRKMLGEAGESVERFVGSGLAELGDKLGPINWQLAATKRFDPDDIDAFLGLLPREIEGLPLRHAIEVRHESFVDPAFVAIARRHRVAIVFAEADDYPTVADMTADFIYARLQRSRDEETGYPAAELDGWAAHAKAWETGHVPDGFATLTPPDPAGPRDVFVFFISGEKVRNPAAARALIERL